MSARLASLHKTPFVLDERPLYEATSPHTGRLSLSRVYRALGLPALVGANLALHKRQRGFAEAQLIESISLLQTVGGECPEDMHLLAGDHCLGTGLGLWSPQSNVGAGVSGTLPRSAIGDIAAQAGSAEELYFPFEPAGY